MKISGISAAVMSLFVLTSDVVLGDLVNQKMRRDSRGKGTQRKTVQPPPPAPVISTSHQTPRRLYKLRVGGTYGFSRYDMQDNTDGSRAVVVSKLNLAPEASLVRKIDPSWSGIVYTRYKFLVLDAPPGVSFQQPNRSLLTFGLGAQYNLDEDRALTALVLREDEAYVHALTASTYSTDVASIYKLKPGISYHLAEVFSGDLRFKADGWAGLPSSTGGYNTKLGLGFSAFFDWTRQIGGGRSIDIGFGYSYAVKNTDPYNMTEQELGVRAGYTWEF